MTPKITNPHRLTAWFVVFCCGCALLLFSQRSVQAQREERPSMTVAGAAKASSESPSTTKGESNPVTPTSSPCTSVIWDNGPFNNVTGLASEENTLVPRARTADDFVLTSSATIETITFDIYANTPVTQPGAVDIYAHSGGVGPVNALPLATYTSTTFTVVGSGFGYDIRRYTVTLSPPLTLAAGRYWVSGYVIGTGSGRGFLCTSNGAVPSTEQEGHFRSDLYGSRTGRQQLPLASHHTMRLPCVKKVAPMSTARCSFSSIQVPMPPSLAAPVILPVSSWPGC